MIRPVLVGALAAAAIGCGGDVSEKGDGDASAFERIGSEAEPLRSRFEADSGDVRAIFLVSPT